MDVSRIRTEHGEMRSIAPYSVRMRGNADQNNSEYGHSSRSESCCCIKGNIQEKLFEESGLETLKSPMWVRHLYYTYKSTNTGTPNYLPKIITNREQGVNTRNKHMAFLIIEQMKEILYSDYYRHLM